MKILHKNSHLLWLIYLPIIISCLALWWYIPQQLASSLQHLGILMTFFSLPYFLCNKPTGSEINKTTVLKLFCFFVVSGVLFIGLANSLVTLSPNSINLSSVWQKLLITTPWLLASVLACRLAQVDNGYEPLRFGKALAPLLSSDPEAVTSIGGNFLMNIAAMTAPLMSLSLLVIALGHQFWPNWQLGLTIPNMILFSLLSMMINQNHFKQVATGLFRKNFSLGLIYALLITLGLLIALAIDVIIVQTKPSLLSQTLPLFHLKQPQDPTLLLITLGISWAPIYAAFMVPLVKQLGSRRTLLIQSLFCVSFMLINPTHHVTDPHSLIWTLSICLLTLLVLLHRSKLLKSMLLNYRYGLASIQDKHASSLYLSCLKIFVLLTALIFLLELWLTNYWLLLATLPALIVICLCVIAGYKATSSCE